MHYSYKDIKEAYKRAGVEKGRVVSLKTDLSPLGKYEKPEKNHILQAHYDALSELIDLGKGTLVVATSTVSLCNTDIPFDRDNTPSEVGILTEYIRTIKGAYRSFHPFESYAAIGKDAEAICGDVSRYAYGIETPEDRLVTADALCVSIGLPPRLTCSTIHHVEMVMGVPYRYVKEYLHPVIREGAIQRECFYRYVWYRQCNIKKNGNKKIFNGFLEAGNVVNTINLGRGNVYSYALADFFRCSVQLFKKDIYIWLDEIPEVKPYRD